MTVRGFRDVRRKARRMKRNLDKEPKKEVRRGMGVVRHEQKSLVVEHNALASMTLLRSFTRREMVGPSGQWRYEHKNTAPYAGFVEHGTGPKGDGTYVSPAYGPRLVAGLKQWAIAKPTVNVTFLDAWAQSAARTISQEGTVPQPFFWPVWETHESVIVGRVRAAVKDAVRHS